MKIEIGKRYVTRNGSIIRIYNKEARANPDTAWMTKGADE